MNNGEINQNTMPRRTFVGALALTMAGTLGAGCTPAKETAAPAGSPSAAVAAVKHFGSAGYGKLTIGAKEQEALATGELQTSPVSTALGRTVYSFVDGPKPDASRMAADEKLEKEVEKADNNEFGDSAAGSAKAATAYADSTQRMVERLEAYLTAGGATFEGGTLASIAAPQDAVTEAGIKRGSTVAELKAAYEAKGLKSSSKSAYELPVEGHTGWTMLFELNAENGDVVKYMSLGRSS